MVAISWITTSWSVDENKLSISEILCHFSNHECKLQMRTLEAEMTIKNARLVFILIQVFLTHLKLWVVVVRHNFKRVNKMIELSTLTLSAQGSILYVRICRLQTSESETTDVRI